MPTDWKPIPTVISHLLRYSPGDCVETCFGCGVIHYYTRPPQPLAVKLPFGAILHTWRENIIPRCRLLPCPNLPKGSKVYFVLSSSLLPAEIRSYNFHSQTYTIQLEKGSYTSPLNVPGSSLRLSRDNLVYVHPIGQGVISQFHALTDIYEVLFLGGVRGFIPSTAVIPLDRKWVSKVPSIPTSMQVFEAFEGRLLWEDAEQLSRKGRNLYSKLKLICTTNADLVALLSTQLRYGNEYRDLLLSSWLDSSVVDCWVTRVRPALYIEWTTLRALVATKTTQLEENIFHGEKTLQEFIAQAIGILGHFRKSHEIKKLNARFRVSMKKQWLALTEDEVEREEVRAAHVAMVPPEAFPCERLILSDLLSLIEERYACTSDKWLWLLQTPTERILQVAFANYTMELHEKVYQYLRFIDRQICVLLQVRSFWMLTPETIAKRLEARCPCISKRVSRWVDRLQQYIQAWQFTSNGKIFLNNFRKVIQAIDNPELFRTQLDGFVSTVTYEKLGAWGSILVSDRAKRQKIIDKVKDHCLDFLISVLPSIKMDTLHGVYERIEYSLAHLDISSFRIRKEYVKVRLGNFTDDEIITVRAHRLKGRMHNLEWTFAQKYFPYLNGSGLADAYLSGGLISLGLKAERQIVNRETQEFRPILVLHSIDIEIRDELKLTVQKSWFSALYNLLTSMFATLIREYVAKTIESKILMHLVKFLETLNQQMEMYWPLIFQVLEMRVEDLPIASPWRGAKPVDIQPDDVELQFKSVREIPYTFNKGVLHRHMHVSGYRAAGSDLEATPESMFTAPSSKTSTAATKQIGIGSRLIAINGLSCAKLSVPELSAVLQNLTEELTIRFSKEPEDITKALQARQKLHEQRLALAQPKIVEVVLSEEGPFGILLRERPLARYGAIVVGFADGPSKTQAEKSGRIKPGMILIKVNEMDLRFHKLPELLEILRAATSRPATLRFASTPDTVVTLRDWPPMIELEVEEEDDEDDDDEDESEASTLEKSTESLNFVKSAELSADVEGLSLNVPKADMRNRSNLFQNYVTIAGFQRAPSQAQKCRLLDLGDVLLSVNGTPLTAPFQESFASILSSLREIVTSKQPMHAIFVSKEDFMKKSILNSEKIKGDEDAGERFYEIQKKVTFSAPPLGILFGNLRDQAAYILRYTSSQGPAERTKVLRVGNAILQICGENVGMESTPASIEQMIHQVRGPPYSISVRDLELQRALFKM
ncbi:unnamed protein product [Albugo candida]|uniref:PDZ domain-containing protein n=1 Tax=Albugo candida TaxID=65357 RepID=A0A024G753_9STRA|nr:unnamed protein product [Albugo candida]|eukprot:CCI42479.1 unnamed protein product [Albugo candida]